MTRADERRARRSASPRISPTASTTAHQERHRPPRQDRLTPRQRKNVIMRSLSIAATGMLAQQLNVEVISNNIANLNTTAFKRQRAEFQDLLYQDRARRSAPISSDTGTIVPVGVQIGTGVKAAAVYRIAAAGQSHQHQQPARSRDPGSRLSPGADARRHDRLYARRLVPAEPDRRDRHRRRLCRAARRSPFRRTPRRSPSTPTARCWPHRRPDGAADGRPARSSPTFPNEAGLDAAGQQPLDARRRPRAPPRPAIPARPRFGTIQQGFLETSNVNVVSEITNLITAQRAYEMNSKVIQTSDQMMSTLNQIQ